MRIRPLKAKLFLLMTLAGGVAFQATGCSVLTGYQRPGRIGSHSSETYQ